MGLEREGGNNAAVEGSLNAPQVGGGRASRRAAAAEVVEKTGRSSTVLTGASTRAMQHSGRLFQYAISDLQKISSLCDHKRCAAHCRLTPSFQ